MKNFIIIAMTVLLSSCATTINQKELYGTVEDIVKNNNSYTLKVWATDKKYYTVHTYQQYQIGSYIKIK